MGKQVWKKLRNSDQGYPLASSKVSTAHCAPVVAAQVDEDPSFLYLSCAEEQANYNCPGMGQSHKAFRGLLLENSCDRIREGHGMDQTINIHPQQDSFHAIQAHIGSSKILIPLLCIKHSLLPFIILCKFGSPWSLSHLMLYLS